MARRRRQKTLGDALAELSIDFAADMARTIFAKQYPQLAAALLGDYYEGKTDRGRLSPEPKTNEVKVGDNLYYTPPPAKGNRSK